MSNNFDQFISITGCDADTAMYYLEAAGQDVETAVQLYFDNNGAQAPTANNNNRNNSASSPIYIPPDDVPEPAPQVAQRLLDNSPVAGFAPNINPFAQQSFQQFGGNASLPTRPIYAQPQQPQPQPQPSFVSNSSSSSSSSNISNNNKNSRQDLFNKLFEAPPSFKGTFEVAKETAKKENKWLIIHIHDTTDFHSLRMNRDTWSNDILQTILETYFIFWQAESNTQDGTRVKNLYHEKPFFIGIIDPRTGEKVKTWYDFVSPKQLNEDLPKFVDAHIMEQFTFADAPSQSQMSSSSVSASSFASQPQPQRHVTFNVPQPQPQQSQPQPQPQFAVPDMDEDAELAMAIAASLEAYNNNAANVAPQAQQPSSPAAVRPQLAQEAIKPKTPPQAEPEPEPEAPAAETATVFADASVDPDQYITTSKENSTRLQLKHLDNSRDVLLLSLDAPLAAIYALFRRKLPADQASKKFTVLNFNTELANTCDETLEQKPDIRSAALTIRMDE